MPDRFVPLASFVLALFVTQLAGTAQEAVRRGEAVAPRSAPGGSSNGAMGSGLPAAAPMMPAGRTTLIDPNKKLAPGDQVSVEIVEDREGAFPKIVTATGDLDVPPLDRVHVAGKTTAQAQADIKQRLEADYYYKATVKVSIDRVNSDATMGSLYISGQVRAPGVLQVFSGENLTISGAILRASDFTEWADPKKVQITRKKGAVMETFIVNVREIREKGLVDKDMVLQDGDRVFVPKVFIRY